MYIYRLKLWAQIITQVIRSAIFDDIFKKKNNIYVQKVAFLANFERIFEKFQSVAKF